MTPEEKDKIEAILIDLASQIAGIRNADEWFEEISEAIRDI